MIDCVLPELSRRPRKHENIMAAARRNLGSRSGHHVLNCDSFDLDLGVVLLAPFYGVFFIEPLVVFGQEMRPVRNPQCCLLGAGALRKEKEWPHRRGGRACEFEEFPARVRFLAADHKASPLAGHNARRGVQWRTGGFPLFTFTPLLVAEFPGELQTGEVSIECRIERSSIRLVDLIEECVRGDCTVPRVESGRAKQLHCASVSPASIFLSFCRAGRSWRVLARESGNRIRSLRRPLQEVQLIASLNNG